MKKIFRKILSAVLACTIFIQILGCQTAFAESYKKSEDISSRSLYVSDYLTDENMEFMKELEKLYPYFDFDSNGSLILKEDIEKLKIDLQLDNEFVEEVNKILNTNINRNLGYTNLKSEFSDRPIITPQVHVKNWKVYFTYDEVMESLFAAAQVGPAAIVAALAGLGTAIGGPVGTTIGTIVGYISGVDFMYLVLRASAQKKGIYIGLDWDGRFPVPTQGTW